MIYSSESLVGLASGVKIGTGRGGYWVPVGGGVEVLVVVDDGGGVTDGVDKLSVEYVGVGGSGAVPMGGIGLSGPMG